MMSDSQVALSSSKMKSKVVIYYVTSANELGIHNRLTICWISNHEGCSCNERTDHLKKGSSVC